jgi:YHS domain-containing protein
MTLDLRIIPNSASSFSATYTCPCGCTPSVAYARDADATTDSCCCGNEFAVGPDARSRVREGHGFHREFADAASPWGETVPVAWAIGPSTHDQPASGSADHEGSHGTHEHPVPGEPDMADATDPVCGMTVDRAAALTKGLHTSYKGKDYFFCGKGCKLEFGDDPERFLDPSYTPSM